MREKREREKYQDLVEECQEKGWLVWCTSVEVGCRGFAGTSLFSCFTSSPRSDNKRRRTAWEEAAVEAERRLVDMEEKNGYIEEGGLRSGENNADQFQHVSGWA